MSHAAVTVTPIVFSEIFGMGASCLAANTVFQKTSKGHEEIGKRSYGLGPTCRRILIVIDGRNPVSAIATMFPDIDVSLSMTRLRAEGFAAPIEAQERSLGSPNEMLHAFAQPIEPALKPQPHVSHDRRIEQAKLVMASSAQSCLGLLSIPLMARIERAHTRTELTSIAGHWHIAIRESKLGKGQAEILLESVRNLLNDVTVSEPTAVPHERTN